MKKKSFSKQMVALIASLLMILGLIGCGESTKTEQTSNQNKTENKQSEKPKDEVKEFYNVGETAKFKGVEMTVAKVDRSKGDDIDTPKEGSEYVIATVKIKNGAKDKLSYNPIYFKMQNSKGQIEDETFSTINENTALKCGELAPGGEVEGTIIFEEPAGDNGLILQYQDNIFSDKVKLQFKLNQ